MKNLLILLLTLSLALVLAACGETAQGNVTDSGTNGSGDDAPVSVDTTDSTESSDTSDTTAPEKVTIYAVKLDNGTVIELGGEADALIASLGDPVDYMEAPSCIHTGYDKVYTYDGYSINTSPAADGTQYIAELALLSDVVAFEDGLMIGGTAADVEAQFGTEFDEQFGVRTYKLDGVTVSITLDGDTVTGITLSSTRS